MNYPRAAPSMMEGDSAALNGYEPNQGFVLGRFQYRESSRDNPKILDCEIKILPAIKDFMDLSQRENWRKAFVNMLKGLGLQWLLANKLTVNPQSTGRKLLHHVNQFPLTPGPLASVTPFVGGSVAPGHNASQHSAMRLRPSPSAFPSMSPLSPSGDEVRISPSGDVHQILP